jgi:hypothetical protein
LVIQAVRQTHDSIAMPPKELLTEEQIAILETWVNEGAAWPSEVLVLFDEEELFIPALAEGEAQIRLEEQDVYSGNMAVAVTQRERFAGQIADWKFTIRENPSAGEYRYLRFAWKKIGSGAAMIEVANSGQWPPAQASPPPGGRYVAGVNTCELDAISVATDTPSDWQVVTLDLWNDLGDFELTGLSLMCLGEGEVVFDQLLLARDTTALDEYKLGRGKRMFRYGKIGAPLGDAWHDPENPVTKTFNGKRLDLWSLQKAERPAMPAVKNSEWCRNPIDRLVMSRLEEKGLTPSAEADRRTLIRRLYFDLTGLPPTPDEVQAFVADQSDNAYEQLVERLLASPHYGERWAKHWLDVVRYADTNGYERDEFRPTGYRYRDYVIRSFNNDKPYDEFIREQLAGDELVAGELQTQADADRLIATGYLRAGSYDSTAPIFQEEARARDQLMADLVNTTCSAFLGLTMACANCHDHKYDPVLQADHFRLRAFFAAVRSEDDRAIDVADERAAIEAHNAAVDAQVAPLAEKIAALGEGDEQKAEREALQAQIDQLNGTKRSFTTAMVMTDDGQNAQPTHIFYQGDHTNPREEVSPGFLSVFDPNPAKIEPTANTTGRRTALANWITSTDNPYTARVMVNRIWQHHFGAPLVATPNDFGYSGSAPTNQQLLDWLACEFMECGWSVKHMHRLMLMSSVYRQQSVADAERTSIDPDNQLLWRQNAQRLDADAMRDAMLAVAGKLLPDSDGKPRWPSVPEDILHAQPAILEFLKEGAGGRMQGWYTDPEETTYVRSIFLVVKRSVPIPFLRVFDLPDPTVSCARRDVTTVAPQALNLLNSEFAVTMAQAMAQRVAAEAGDQPVDQIELAVWLALARPAADDEREVLLKLLQSNTAQPAKADEPPAGLVAVCRTLLNVNEFVYLD